MAQKVITLVSGVFQRTAVECLDINDRAQEPTPLALVQATTSGTIHPDWIPQTATRLTVRDTENSVSVANVYELVVASGDVIDLGNRRVRLRTASDASGGGGGGEPVSDGNKGDITVTGNGSVWTVNQQAITFAKMQSIGTNTVLGRADTGTGSVQELQIGYGLATSNMTVHVRFAPTTDPLTLPTNGLLAYWTAGEGVTLESNSTRVQSWSSTVNSHVLSNSNSSGRPRYVFLYQKYASLQFTDDILSSSIIPASGVEARSLFVVYLPYPRNVYANGVVLSYGNASNFQAYGIATHANNAPMVSVYYYGSVYRNLVSFANACAIVFTFSNRITIPYVNNTTFPQIYDVLLGLSTGTNNGLRVGRGIETNTAFHGFVFDVAVWNRELTSSEVSDIMRQVALKYGDLFYFMR